MQVTAQKFNFRNYTVTNGLGSSNINHIYQDKNGYIWFATQGGGISRFDGKEFKNFTRADGLINNDVTFITEDNTGNIWIGTATGASKFDGSTFTNYGAKQGLTDNTVYGIYVNSSGEVWFALKDVGVRIYNGKQFDSITTHSGLSSNDVYTVNRDSQNNYWLGLGNGIARYDGHSIKNYQSPEYLHDKTFFTSATDSKHNIWFGSISGELVVVHPSGQTELLSLPKNVAGCFIGGITEDHNSNIWIATDHGLLKYANRTFSLFTEKQGLSVNTTQSVICDYEGNIWIGTLGGGANLLNSEAFIAYTQNDGLKTNNINCIYDDSAKHIYYVGTAGKGLFAFNPETAVFKPVLSNSEIKYANITSVYVDDAGLLWITAQEGVYVVENNRGTFNLKHTYHTIAGQKLISPQAIARDKKGHIWIATFGSGVFEIAGDKEKSYSTANGFLSDNTLTVFNDSRGTLWIGTLDAGAILYKGQNFSKFNPDPTFTEKAVWAITEDTANNIYLGTGESGLFCYDQGRKLLCNYNLKDGLCSNYISALKWNKLQNALWTGSEKGVNKIVFDAGHRIMAVNNYNETAGYKSWGINPNSILADHTGQVWFG